MCARRQTLDLERGSSVRPPPCPNCPPHEQRPTWEMAFPVAVGAVVSCHSRSYQTTTGRRVDDTGLGKPMVLAATCRQASEKRRGGKTGCDFSVLRPSNPPTLSPSLTHLQTWSRSCKHVRTPSGAREGAAGARSHQPRLLTRRNYRDFRFLQYTHAAVHAHPSSLPEGTSGLVWAWSRWPSSRRLRLCCGNRR